MFVTSSTYVYALVVATGEYRWQTYLEEYPYALVRPTVNSQKEVLVARGGVLFALDGLSGTVMWTFNTVSADYVRVPYALL